MISPKIPLSVLSLIRDRGEFNPQTISTPDQEYSPGNFETPIEQYNPKSFTNPQAEPNEQEYGNPIIDELQGLSLNPRSSDALAGQNHQNIVEQAGGKFRGVSEGYQRKDGTSTEGLVYFDDPITNTTLALKPSQISPEFVAQHIMESRRKFGKAA